MELPMDLLAYITSVMSMEQLLEFRLASSVTKVLADHQIELRTRANLHTFAENPHTLNLRRITPFNYIWVKFATTDSKRTFVMVVNVRNFVATNVKCYTSSKLELLTEFVRNSMV
jgi:hypothetical protein